MAQLPIVRIFVSSPGDVAEERAVARRVLDRIADRFAGVMTVERIAWEDEPLLATGDFQSQIARPSTSDIFVTILWSRLGTPLPSSIRRPDGSAYESGTEFEFEEAMESFHRTGSPEMLVYRKLAEPVIGIKDKSAARESLRQAELLETFLRRWFEGPQGTLVAAFHPFEDAADFEEHFEQHVTKLLARRAQKLLQQPEPVQRITWTAGSPYRGLETYDMTHQAIFFGRTRATMNALGALTQNAASGRPFLLILGGSGSGKSSLVRAGILPLLTSPGFISGASEWRQAICRPSDAGGNAWQALETALLQPGAVPELREHGGLGALLGTDISQAVSLVQQILRGGRKLVLIIDQLEELFASSSVDTNGRQRFFSVIEQLVGGGVWVLATLRSDFFHRVAEVPSLVQLKGTAGQFELLPPSPTELTAMIQQPAMAAGLTFELDRGTRQRLDQVLCDAATRNERTLPLLSFTLDELYKRRSADGVLTYQAYRDLGELEGALATRANEVFAQLRGDVQGQMSTVFRALVTVGAGSEGKVTRKRAPLSLFPSGTPSRELVEAFIAARLFYTEVAPDGSPVVDIAHEALLTHWEPARQWLSVDRELLRIRDGVSAAADHWQSKRRAADLLLARGLPLEEATRLVRAGFELSKNEEAFIAASTSRVRRTRRLRQFVIGGIALLALLATAGFFIAETNRRQAEDDFRFARKTVDEVLIDISREELSAVPGMQDLRMRFAQKGLERYREFAKRRPRDPDVQRGLGTALTALGTITDQIGAVEKATDHMKAAIAVHERLLAGHPSNIEYAIALGEGWTELARINDMSRSSQDAVEPARKAIAILEPLAKEQSGNTEVTFALADAYWVRGNVHRTTGENAAAAEDFDRSRKLFESIVSIHSKKADCLKGLAAVTHNAGLVKQAAGKYEEALKLLESSTTYDSQALALRPLSPILISNHSIGFRARADVLAQLGRRDEALKNYAEAVRVSREVVKGNPKVTRYGWLLGTNLVGYGSYLRSIGDYKGARAAFDEAASVLDQVTREADDRPHYGTTLIQAHLDLAEFHRNVIGQALGSANQEAYEAQIDAAMTTAQRLATKYPQSIALREAFADAAVRRASAYIEGSRPAKASALFHELAPAMEKILASANAKRTVAEVTQFLTFAELAIREPKVAGRLPEVSAIAELAYSAGRNCQDSEGITYLGVILNVEANLLMNAGQSKKAIEIHRRSADLRLPFLEKKPWHWYMRTNLGGTFQSLAELYQGTGDLRNEVEARQNYLRFVGGPLHGLDVSTYIDPDRPATALEAIRLRAIMAVPTSMKRYTVNCDFGGVIHPLDLYLTNVPWPKDPLEDQARWLLEERGGKIPEDVREWVRTQHKLAHEKQILFTDQMVAAVAALNK